MDSIVKEEIDNKVAPTPLAVADPPERGPRLPPLDAAVIDLSSSSSSDSDSYEEEEGGKDGGKKFKKRKRAPLVDDLLPGFLDPLPPEDEEEEVELTRVLPLPEPPRRTPASVAVASKGYSKQFWKAGDFDESSKADPTPVSAVGMDHVRVHPKFLHSNATSHKWALGAIAELLDNSFDEVCNGATYVNIDMLVNKKDGSRMLLVEDNGGGMDPDKMRQCTSLGYSAKCKVANTIGQYGNGFKTSTMRLGADVIVFSRTRGKEGRRPTQSIGLLSYSFLRNTGKEDIVVPMLDYEKGKSWSKMPRSSVDWDANIDTIIQWSPYSSEADLLHQFSYMKDQGTRVVIYNLWEEDQGDLELDFDTDKHDIQVRGVNRDERSIEMANKFPNSRHFLTYRHSLRSYASILYLRLPHVFRMFLRGKEIQHHNIVNDMMLKQEVTYKPQPGADGILKDPNMVAVVTIGFVKDAKDHIDIQGFNVYHKNRLIKPFWRVWNAAGSGGRGVIGVLEANFVEPAHDKQDFERTTILARLEAKLIQMQKAYWSTNCHRIGYVGPTRNKKHVEAEEKEGSPVATDSAKAQRADKFFLNANSKTGKAGTSTIASRKFQNEKSSLSSSKGTRMKGTVEFGNKKSSPLRSHETSDASNESDHETEHTPSKRPRQEPGVLSTTLRQKAGGKTGASSPSSLNAHSAKEGKQPSTNGGTAAHQVASKSQLKDTSVIRTRSKTNVEEPDNNNIKELKDENEKLKERIGKVEEELQSERKRCKSLTEELQETKNKLDESNKEQEALIDIFSEERSRRDKEEENLRKKLKEATVTIQELLAKRNNHN